jgi:tetratricopeptide (TPR) repeat protein
MSELLQEFGRLLDGLTSGTLGSSTGVLLQLLEPEKADHLRLCAIPHEFGPEILQVLVPAMSKEQAEARCRELAELSIVSSVDDELSLHSTARSEIFGQWLHPENRAAFTEASKRLVSYYDDPNIHLADEWRLHRRMFHLLGADLSRGFADFEQLCRTARRESRWSACANLISLVHEYDPILGPEIAAWLSYHEGKLASDLRDFERAEHLFEALIAAPTASDELRAKALLRQGFIFGARREFDRAIESYQAALRLSESLVGTSFKEYDVLTSLGEAFRDSGELQRAEQLLQQSLAGAEAVEDLSAMANADNALGALYLRRREGTSAATYFQNSLACLERLGDRFRSAQVYNNLGMVNSELGEWDKAENYFQQSLEIKRQAGDTRGQAMTLLNQVRVFRRRNDFAQAVGLNRQAATLFGEIRDTYCQAEAQRTLGRTYAAMNDLEKAREALRNAAALFERCSSGEKAAEVREEAEKLGRKIGLPWWAWLTIIVPLAAFLLLVLLLIFEN